VEGVPCFEIIVPFFPSASCALATRLNIRPVKKRYKGSSVEGLEMRPLVSQECDWATS
jgi:hypothetical protein